MSNSYESQGTWRSGSVWLLPTLGFVLIVSLACNALAVGYYLVTLSERTVFAPGYTEEQFGKLNCTVNVREVIGMVGPPLTVSMADQNWKFIEPVQQPYDPRMLDIESLPETAQYFVWEYSRQRTTTSNYLVRSVTFDRSGSIYRITRDFWVD